MWYLDYRPRFTSIYYCRNPRKSSQLIILMCLYLCAKLKISKSNCTKNLESQWKSSSFPVSVLPLPYLCFIPNLIALPELLFYSCPLLRKLKRWTIFFFVSSETKHNVLYLLKWWINTIRIMGSSNYCHSQCL